jgi:hypothetical protein
MNAWPVFFDWQSGVNLTPLFVSKPEISYPKASTIRVGWTVAFA